MKLSKTLVLSSALVGFACAFTAIPAIAQVSDNGPQYSTPAEREQTRQLNQQSLGGISTSPSALNGQQVAQDTDQDENDAAQPGDETQPPDSSAQDQYREKLQDYRDQRQRYEEQRAEYEHDLRRYDRQQFAYEDFPAHAYAYRYEDNGRYGQALYRLVRPGEQLAQRPIESPDGEWVGKVHDVDFEADGQPARIEVALNRRVSVWVAPDHFRYDPVDGVVMTDLSRDDLWNQTDAIVEPRQ